MGEELMMIGGDEVMREEADPLNEAIDNMIQDDEDEEQEAEDELMTGITGAPDPADIMLDDEIEGMADDDDDGLGDDDDHGDEITVAVTIKGIAGAKLI